MVASSCSPARMLGRGLTRRCAACGGGGLFTGWIRMRERCPRCGHVFGREDGFGLGAILVNLAAVEALLAVAVIVPAIALLAADPQADLVPLAVAGVVAVVVGPVLFYPFARTTWVALELMLRPPQARGPDNRP